MQLEPRSLNCLLIGSAKRKSQALPLPRSHISRTESEIQLEDNQAEAEWRDYCMFQRIIAGITKKQNRMYETLYNLQNDEGRLQGQDRSDNSVNDAIVRNQKCLENIVHTQRKSLYEIPSSSPNRRCYLEATMVDGNTSNIRMNKMSSPSNTTNISSNERLASADMSTKQEVDCSEPDFFFFEI
jgi:hypothetical protein